MSENPYAPPATDVADLPNGADLSDSRPAFFPISLPKLAVMGFVTLGMYQLYWFYRNWQIIKVRENATLWPLPRAIFTVIFCYSCFSRIRQFKAPGFDRPKLAAGAWASLWILFSVLANRGPDKFWFLVYLPVLFLLPVQHYVNELNRHVAPGHDPNGRFTWLNWVGIALGLIFFALLLFGATLPPDGGE